MDDDVCPSYIVTFWPGTGPGVQLVTSPLQEGVQVLPVPTRGGAGAGRQRVERVLVCQCCGFDHLQPEKLNSVSFRHVADACVPCLPRRVGACASASAPALTLESGEMYILRLQVVKTATLGPSKTVPQVTVPGQDRGM